MTRYGTITHEFVELMPKQLTEGVLYVSISYATAVHLCFCGCKSRVVTPLSPAQWSITFNGETITLSPSVGSHDLNCASHYWIRRNEVRWSRRWTPDEVTRGRARDRRDLEYQHSKSGGLATPDVNESAYAGKSLTTPWWRRIKWLRRRR